MSTVPVIIIGQGSAREVYFLPRWPKGGLRLAAYTCGEMPPNYPVPAIPYETIVSYTGRIYVLPIEQADREFLT